MMFGIQIGTFPIQLDQAIYSWILIMFLLICEPDVSFVYPCQNRDSLKILKVGAMKLT